MKKKSIRKCVYKVKKPQQTRQISAKQLAVTIAVTAAAAYVLGFFRGHFS